MPAILEVSRMTDAQLWKHLLTSVNLLATSQLGELPFRERRALARRAAECAFELWTRGQQLQLLV